MDPAPRDEAPRSSRLPRTRGDGPGRRRNRRVDARASPHTRGWTVKDSPSPLARTGFPAHAGMDPGPTAYHGPRRGLPRTRGDGPPSTAEAQTDGKASPHTRGWTRGEQPMIACTRGFPAHAGMDPPRPGARAVPPRLPRTRGDGPASRFTWARITTASPHTRGWTRRHCGGRERNRGFPAHAGMDPTKAYARPATRRLPRTRGDGPPYDVSR